MTARPGTVPSRQPLPLKAVSKVGSINLPDDDNEDIVKIEEGAVDKAKLLTEDELNDILANSPAPLVTKEYMKARVTNIEFTRLKGTTTHCQITLDNDFSFSGESACVNPENFEESAGQKLAYDNAFSKMWSYFGFLLAEKNFLNKSKTE